MKYQFLKTKLDKKFKYLIIIFLTISLILSGIVLIDSFSNQLPFYYISFFILGLFLSKLFRKVQKIEWNKEEEQIIKTMNLTGILLLVILIIARSILLPYLIKYFNVRFVSDAITLVAIGIFYGRVKYFLTQIDKIVYGNFINKNKNTK